ncbi:hypothetical protein [Geodermatophilus sp. URMC 63]
MPWQIALIILGFAAFLAALGVKVTVPGINIDLKEQLENWQRVLVASTGIGLTVIGLLFSVNMIPTPGSEDEHRANDDLQLADYYADNEGDTCFTGAPYNLVFGDDLFVVEEQVQCRYTPADVSRPQVYTFNIPKYAPGAKIVGFSGTFGIDESGDANHPGAEAFWTVSQDERVLCEPRAEWKKLANCDIKNPIEIVPDEPLVITEVLVRFGPHNGGELFLGIALPRLEIRT